MLVYKKGSAVFAFNFHPVNAYDGCVITEPGKGDYQVVLSSDDFCFGGQGRIHHNTYEAVSKNGAYGVQLYLPCRTAVVLQKID